MHFDLCGMNSLCEVAAINGKRAACADEVEAYMRWQCHRHGLPAFEAVELHWHGWESGRRIIARHCTGATFGKMIRNSVWRGEGAAREYIPPKYEDGAYSIIMPGGDVHKHRVTMETLDESGEVVASSTLPVEPKKGGVIWDRAAVRKAAGPIAKAAKPRKPKPAPTVEIEAAPPIPVQAGQAGAKPEICTQEPQESESPSTPGGPSSANQVAALLARVEALEERLATLPAVSTDTPTDGEPESNMTALPPDPRTTCAARARREIEAARSRRSPAHEWAIRRAWDERKARRLAMALYDVTKVECETLEAERLRVADLAREARAERDHALSQLDDVQRDADKHHAKRRRAVLLARRRGKNMVAVYQVARARLDELQADLAKARRAPTYFDGDGMERRDVAALAFDHGRHALDKAEGLSAKLDAATAAIKRQELAINTLSDELQVTMTRALKAERALAAVTARRDGWPPAARVASVSFAIAG